ncbi:MAG TPA: phosphopantetheine-binding protein [Thermoanaerobaculia bacterium]|jgi:acyl carrier protein|nr:phosphopantetheine-binding protein [Thermoanaerobaculia bacterium]
MTDSIETRVIAAIVRSQEVDPGKVTPAATFEELGMNSLDAIALINDLEEEFGVAIPNDEAMGLTSVGEAVECIQRLSP